MSLKQLDVLTYCRIISILISLYVVFEGSRESYGIYAALNLCIVYSLLTLIGDILSNLKHVLPGLLSGKNKMGIVLTVTYLLTAVTSFSEGYTVGLLVTLFGGIATLFSIALRP